VLAAPTKCERGPCYTREKRSDAARRLLKRAGTGLPVTLVDPGDSFDGTDFWRKDAHWNAAGHRKIAEALLPAVSDALADRPVSGTRGQ
ncbi:MAG: SGNH/GDSL hydrolase family protein, partial [Chromatiales bacterium]|nr:SGNH/GDSL hydrolase family protein [Chromatiales bacterium]